MMGEIVRFCGSKILSMLKAMDFWRIFPQSFQRIKGLFAVHVRKPSGTGFFL